MIYCDISHLLLVLILHLSLFNFIIVCYYYPQCQSLHQISTMRFPFSGCWRAHYFLSCYTSYLFSACRPYYQYFEEPQNLFVLSCHYIFFKSIEGCLIELFHFLAVLLFLNIMSYLLTFIHFPSIRTFSVSFLPLVRMKPRRLSKNRSMDSGTYSEKFKGKVNKRWMSSAALSKPNILDVSFLWMYFKSLNMIFLKTWFCKKVKQKPLSKKVWKDHHFNCM